MRHDGFDELSQGDYGTCMGSFYPFFYRHCMDIIDSVVDFSCFNFFFIYFRHDRFPVRYPDLLATLFVFSLISMLGTKEGHDCTICVEKTCGLEHLAFNGEFLTCVCMCVWAASIWERMFSAPVLLAFFLFFDAEKKGARIRASDRFHELWYLRAGCLNNVCFF